VTPFDPDQRPELAPLEPGIGAPACEVHWIVDAIAAADELLDPLVGIIIDPEISVRGAGKARMIEQCEMIEAELKRDIAEQGAKLRQIAAGLGGLGEAVAEPLHGHSPREHGLGKTRKAPPPHLPSILKFSANKLPTDEYI